MARARYPRPTADRHESRRVARMYADHAEFVRNKCRRLGVPPSDAEDTMQTVFIVVQRRISSFDGRSVRGWLYGITRRVVLDYHRHQHRISRPVESVVEPQEQDLETKLESQRRQGEVMSVLEQVEPLKREVLVMSDISGFSASEIATALDANINTVYSRLRAGRKLFAKLLSRQQRRSEWSRHLSKLDGPAAPVAQAG